MTAAIGHSKRVARGCTTGRTPRAQRRLARSTSGTLRSSYHCACMSRWSVTAAGARRAVETMTSVDSITPGTAVPDDPFLCGVKTLRPRETGCVRSAVERARGAWAPIEWREVRGAESGWYYGFLATGRRRQRPDPRSCTLLASVGKTASCASRLAGSGTWRQGAACVTAPRL